MKRYILPAFALFISVVAFVFEYEKPSAQEVDCLMCHSALSQEKVVHPAVQMGCQSCHVAVDATKFPHEFTNKVSRGLSSEHQTSVMAVMTQRPFQGKRQFTCLLWEVCAPSATAPIQQTQENSFFRNHQTSVMAVMIRQSLLINLSMHL